MHAVSTVLILFHVEMYVCRWFIVNPIICLVSECTVLVPSKYAYRYPSYLPCTNS